MQLVNLPVPSLAMPCRAMMCETKGMERIPSSIMLLGNEEDRELLSVELALEKVLKSLPL